MRWIYLIFIILLVIGGCDLDGDATEEDLSGYITEEINRTSEYIEDSLVFLGDYATDKSYSCLMSYPKSWGCNTCGTTYTCSLNWEVGDNEFRLYDYEFYAKNGFDRYYKFLRIKGDFDYTELFDAVEFEDVEFYYVEGQKAMIGNDTLFLFDDCTLLLSHSNFEYAVQTCFLEEDYSEAEKTEFLTEIRAVAADDKDAALDICEDYFRMSYTEYAVEECNYWVATGTLDTEECKSLPESRVENCYVSIANLKQDVEVCNLVTNEPYRNRCIEGLTDS